jgi:magnesium-transporting ATPase (P-type)
VSNLGDKTGTLTRNEMTVQEVITVGRLFAVSGLGFAPHGGFSLDDREVAADDRPELIDIGRVSLLCNDAVLEQA